VALKIPHEGYKDFQAKLLEGLVETLIKGARVPREISGKRIPSGALGFGKDRAPDDPRELLEHSYSIILFGQREIELGRTCWTERWYETSDWPWHWKCRDCCHVAYAVLSHPNLDEVWSGAVDCAMQAAVAMTIAAIIAGGEAAVPAFCGYFYPCMIAKGIAWAKEISVNIAVRDLCNSDHDC
jgi:hypothetical protein